MYREEKVTTFLDWPAVLIFIVCVIMGWINIFAAVYDVENVKSIFDWSLNSGKQLMWIGTTVLLVIVIMVIDYKFYDYFAYIIYGAIILLLIGVLGAGTTIAGSKSWFKIGAFAIQPSEFAKFGTALALAKYLSSPGASLTKQKDLITVGAIIAFPAILILLQNDTGSTLVFSSFVIVLYREGLSPIVPILGIVAVFLFIMTLLVPQNYLLIGIGVVAVIALVLTIRNARGGLTTYRNIRNVALILACGIVASGFAISVNYFVTDVLQPHQQDRVKALVDPGFDPKGAGWNVTQSKIAIGSGGVLGKGFLEGTQTKFDFVPEQSTDFIFCTIGEEHGWIGSLVVISLFIGLFCRLVFLAERQKDKFVRIYGYAVASIMFFHFFVNIGMTIGLMPVIGIPLPFFSYGGSSLWSFSILLFIFLKLDAHRLQTLARY